MRLPIGMRSGNPSIIHSKTFPGAWHPLLIVRDSPFARRRDLPPMNAATEKPVSEMDQGELSEELVRCWERAAELREMQDISPADQLEILELESRARDCRVRLELSRWRN